MFIDSGVGMGGSGGGGGYSGGSGSGGGSGGSGGGGGFGGGGPVGVDQCNLVINATIHAPNSAYAIGLSIGSVLTVALGGPNGRTIEVYDSSGNLIGSLIGLTQAAQLISCIQANNSYAAAVIQINAGVFGVRVTRVDA